MRPSWTKGRGAGGGNQALKPLALTSHLHGLSGGSSPFRAWVEGESEGCPLGSSGSLPSTAPSPFLGKCISYSVCNSEPSPPPPGVWSRGWGAVGWPPMPGVGLGVICIETSPKPGGVGLRERPSPQCALGQAEVHDYRTLLRVLATCPGPLATPGVSPQPSSALVTSLPTSASMVASNASNARCWGPPRPWPRGACLPTWQTVAGAQLMSSGEVASLGVPPCWPGAGTRLRSPGPGQRRERPSLPEQQQREEMNNLGRPLRAGSQGWQGLALWSSPSGRGFPRVRSVAIFTFCLLGWVGLFLCVAFFFFPCFFFFSPFFLSFFPPVCMCLYGLSFGRAGRRRGVLACFSFPPKTWAGGQLCSPPGFPGRRSRAWEEIFLIPDTRTGWPREREREGERDREMGVRL